ncbi:protein-tyrosine phosphatase-like protein, partial [Pelagophyceae sp. CCMP2097]
IYLGAESLSLRRDRLLELKVTHVLSVAPLIEARFPEDFIYCKLRVSDAESARQDILKAELTMGRRFINNAVRAGGRVVVCCSSGTNRSCAMMIAYLMWENSLALSTAYRLVRLHEPDLRIN